MQLHPGSQVGRTAANGAIDPQGNPMTANTQTAPSCTPVGTGSTTGYLREQQVREIVAQVLAPLDLAGKKVLLIVPDSTRTAPVGLLFRVIHDLIGAETKKLDVL